MLTEYKFQCIFNVCFPLMLIANPNGSYRKAVGTKSWQYNVYATNKFHQFSLR